MWVCAAHRSALGARQPSKPGTIAMHLRRKLVVGNWKMNGSLAALAELAPIAEAAREAGGVDVAHLPALHPDRAGGHPLGRPRSSARRIATRRRAAPIPAASRCAMIREAGAPHRHRRPQRAPRRPARERRGGPRQGRGGARRRADRHRLRRRERRPSAGPAAMSRSSRRCSPARCPTIGRRASWSSPTSRSGRSAPARSPPPPTSPRCTPRSAPPWSAATATAADAHPHPLRRLGQGRQCRRAVRGPRRRRRPGRRRQPHRRRRSCRSSRRPLAQLNAAPPIA